MRSTQQNTQQWARAAQFDGDLHRTVSSNPIFFSQGLRARASERRREASHDWSAIRRHRSESSDAVLDALHPSGVRWVWHCGSARPRLSACRPWRMRCESIATKVPKQASRPESTQQTNCAEAGTRRDSALVSLTNALHCCAQWRNRHRTISMQSSRSRVKMCEQFHRSQLRSDQIKGGVRVEVH